MAPIPQWLTKKQAAEKLQVCVKTIDRYVVVGKLDLIRITARNHRITAASIERLMS